MTKDSASEDTVHGNRQHAESIEATTAAPPEMWKYSAWTQHLHASFICADWLKHRRQDLRRMETLFGDALAIREVLDDKELEGNHW